MTRFPNYYKNNWKKVVILQHGWLNFHKQLAELNVECFDSQDSILVSNQLIRGMNSMYELKG